DHEQRRIVDRRRRVDRLLQGVKATEAPDPTNHESALEAETLAQRTRVRTVVERLKVDAARCDDDAITRNPEMTHALGNEIGPAGNQVGPNEHPLLPRALQPTTPDRASSSPLLGFPDQWGRDEQDRGGLERPSEFETSSMEELVALPYEA